MAITTPSPSPSPRRESSRRGAQNPLGHTFNLNTTKNFTLTFPPASPGEGSVTSELPSFLLHDQAEGTPPSPALQSTGSNSPSVSMREAIAMSFIYPSKSSYTSGGVALSQPTDFSDNISNYMHEDFDVEDWSAERMSKKQEQQSNQSVNKAITTGQGDSHQSIIKAITTGQEEPHQSINNAITRGQEESHQSINNAVTRGHEEHNKSAISEPKRGHDATYELRKFLKDRKLGSIYGPAPILAPAPVPEPTADSILNYPSIIESETLSQAKSQASSRVSSRVSSRALSKAPSRITESKASSQRSFSRSSRGLSGTILKTQIESFSRPPTPNFDVPTFDWLTQADQTQTSVSTQMLPTTEHVLNQLQDLQFQIEQYQSENAILKDETEAVRLEVSDLRKAKEALKSQVATLQTSLQNSNKVVQETKDLADLERERYMREIAELKAALDASKAQKDNLQSENTALKTLQESTKDQRDLVLHQYNTLKAQHDEVRAENKTLKNEAKLTKAASRELSKSHKELLEGKINTYKTKLSGAYTKISEYSNKIAQLEVTNAELGIKVHELGNQSTKLEMDNTRIKNELQNSRRASSSIQTELEAGKTASATMKEAYDKLQKERNMFARILMHNWGINEAGLRQRADGIVGAGYKYRFINKDGGKEIKFLF